MKASEAREIAAGEIGGILEAIKEAAEKNKLEITMVNLSDAEKALLRSLGYHVSWSRPLGEYTISWEE